MSTLTVSIPFHRNSTPQEVSACLESIINQTRKPDVIHLIQDGNVHFELEQVIEKFLSQNKERTLLIKNIATMGLAYSINRSILLSNTDFYARMDADDICLPERFEIQVNELEKDNEIMLLGSQAIEFINNYKQNPLNIKALPTTTMNIYKIFHFRDPFIHPTVMFRREFFIKVGLYDTRYKKSQDTELWARMIKHKVKAINIDKPLLYFRMKNTIQKRANWTTIYYEYKARFSLNTYNPLLFTLKVASIIFRLTPYKFQAFSYRHIRNLLNYK